MLKQIQHQRINHDPNDEDKDAHLVAVPKSAERSPSGEPPGPGLQPVPGSTSRTRGDTHASVSQREKRAKRRMCAVHRIERPIDELIKFVAGPTDIIVADFKHNLPGRGVWVTADKASIGQAIARKALDRGLKKVLKASPDLPNQIEALLTKRVCDALSLANKAGAAIAGFTKIDLAIQKQALTVLIQAGDAATDGRDKLSRKFIANCLKSVPEQRIVTILTTGQLSLAMGRSNVVHAGLTDSGMAKTFLFEAKRLERYGQGFAATLADGNHHVGNE